MKPLNNYITEKFRITNTYKRQAYKPKSFWELQNIIEKRYKENPEYLDCTDIDVSDIEQFNQPKNIADCIGLFQDYDKTKVIDITGWNMNKAIYINRMFSDCARLTEIKGLENIEMPNLVNTSYMFYNCISLKTLDFRRVDFGGVRVARSMFWNCGKLTHVGCVDTFDPQNIRDAGYMFDLCKNEIIPDWYDVKKHDKK